MSKPFTVASLAEHLECSQDTIRRMIENGQLPTFRVGARLLRIRAEDVEQWVKSGGSIRSENTGSSSSRAKPSPSGKTRKAVTAEDWASRSPK